MKTKKHPTQDDHALSESQLKHESYRVLRRLCESGAVLAVAADMENAVVVRDTEFGGTTRTAVVEREIAEAMALKHWISCDAPGRVSRYQITGVGRAALNKLIAERENHAVGFVEAQTGFDLAGAGEDDFAPAEMPRNRRARYGVAETPLIALARRKDRDGTRFLSAELVRAGERLREDFELAQMSARKTQNWDQFLSDTVDEPTAAAGGHAADAARARVIEALRELGPGLGDVALLCCCYLEGLERAEKNMGWSARSGKIVLRIALQRLRRHYEGLGDAAAMIG